MNGDGTFRETVFVLNADGPGLTGSVITPTSEQPLVDGGDLTARRFRTRNVVNRLSAVPAQLGQKVSPQGALKGHPAVHPGRSEGRSVMGRIGFNDPTREGADFLCSS